MRNDEDVKSPISGKSTEQPKPPAKPGNSPLNRKDDDEEKPRKVQDDDDGAPPWAKKLIDGFGELNKRICQRASLGPLISE
jgi:hypothetical protein